MQGHFTPVLYMSSWIESSSRTDARFLFTRNNQRVHSDAPKAARDARVGMKNFAGAGERTYRTYQGHSAIILL